MLRASTCSSLYKYERNFHVVLRVPYRRRDQQQYPLETTPTPQQMSNWTRFEDLAMSLCIAKHNYHLAS